jgi:hypothetical protein
MFKNLFGSKKEEPTPNEIQELEEALIEAISVDQENVLYDDFDTEIQPEEFEEWDATLEDGLEPEPVEVDSDYLLNASEIVGWSSTQEQELLFSALLLFYSPEMSILDAGCGRADLFGYLTKTFGVEVPYKGIDYNPNILAIAQEKYPTVNVDAVDILNMSENADWIVASGLFNIKEQEDMATYTQQCIDKMYESANIGIAFNLLTGYPDNIADEDKAVLAPHNPSVWLDYLLGKYTKVICRTDYMLGDVTFFILK